MTTEVSETGHRYQLILRGECGPLTGWLFGDVTIETGNGCTSLTFSARDDSELYGLLDRIQDLALHLISLYEIGGTEAVPHPPVRARLAHPVPLYGRGTPYPPVGSRGLAAAPPPAVIPETLKHPAASPCTSPSASFWTSTTPSAVIVFCSASFSTASKSCLAWLGVGRHEGPG